MVDLTVVPGSRKDVIVTCRLQGGGPALYQAADVLSAEVWPATLTARLFAASATWHTGRGTQTGYEQGEVVGSIAAAQAATLQPSARYWLRIFRAIGGPSGEPEEIATILFRIRLPSPA